MPEDVEHQRFLSAAYTIAVGRPLDTVSVREVAVRLGMCETRALQIASELHERKLVVRVHKSFPQRETRLVMRDHGIRLAVADTAKYPRSKTAGALT